MSTRWLLTGAGGRLGRALLRRLDGQAVTALTRADLDVTDRAAVGAAVAGHDVVLNCAAWTAVDAAEAEEAAAWQVNALGPAHLGGACAEHGARLVHVSTDYVFDGLAISPYAEDAPVAPRTAYGRTKAAGEWAVRASGARAWVVRTAWLYGEGGDGFPATVLRLLAERGSLGVVDDQRGQPTSADDLAERLLALVAADPEPGTFHGTATGATTWFELARTAVALTGGDPAAVRPTTTAAFPSAAVRPAYSVLGHDGWARAGLGPMRSWDTALAEALAR